MEGKLRALMGEFAFRPIREGLGGGR